MQDDLPEDEILFCKELDEDIEDQVKELKLNFAQSDLKFKDFIFKELAGIEVLIDRITDRINEIGEDLEL